MFDRHRIRLDEDEALGALVEFLNSQIQANPECIEITFKVKDVMWLMNDTQRLLPGLRMLVSLRVLSSKGSEENGHPTIFTITKVKAQRLIKFVNQRGEISKDPLIWEI